MPKSLHDGKKSQTHVLSAGAVVARPAPAKLGTLVSALAALLPTLCPGLSLGLSKEFAFYRKKVYASLPHYRCWDTEGAGDVTQSWSIGRMESCHITDTGVC